MIPRTTRAPRNELATTSAPTPQGFAEAMRSASPPNATCDAGAVLADEIERRQWAVKR